MKPQNIDHTVWIKEGGIYQAPIRFEQGNWNVMTRPHIPEHHVLGFFWENSDNFVELHQTKEGDEKFCIFRVTAVNTTYSPRRYHTTKIDAWKDEVHCEILKIQ